MGKGSVVFVLRRVRFSAIMFTLKHHQWPWKDILHTDFPFGVKKS